ncbi:MAG TPA: hypothetical protein VG268_05615 [Streptosporangiaceae bacterium]|nr:hypothetical protein [Streptosporangiaceae bacterium]
MPAMAVRERPGRPGGAAPRGLGDRDIGGMLYTAEMYGLPVDLLAVVLAGTLPQARAAVTRWHRLGYAESARLGPGPPWVWLTRAGLAACGLRYGALPPALSRLAHIRAVTTVRLALEATAGYQQAGAFWRSERRLRARSGGRTGLREHLPDGEVHWPDSAAADGDPMAWAGECWAIEAELTRKTVSRTTAIMRELLTRTADYGGPASEVRVPGRPVRHTRVLYVCSPSARPTVLRARAGLGAAAARVEVRDLPARAALEAAG